MIKGFVFDFDGLILDTETPLFEVYRELFADYGVEISLHQWWKIIGTGLGEYNPLEHLVQVAGDHHHKEDFRALIDERVDERLNRMSPFPGVVDFIRHAFQMGIPMSVASSSSRQWVHHHLDRLELTPLFQHILTVDDVHLPKPDPELYILAASRMGISASELTAFEDSLNGIKAAKAAGLYCIAIPNDMTREMNLNQADKVVNSFTELAVAGVLSFEFDKNLL